MTKLDPAERAKLPDSAFAYIDSRGQRRLPIHDEAHVRNALARFGRVRFEDERARERARKRLLNAAKRYGIVPVGFIAGQLRSEREYGQLQATEPVQLPSGFVTMLLTDIEDSTALLDHLVDGYGTLLDEVRGVLRAAAADVGGVEVETRADECFIVFERPGPALEMAVRAQRELLGRSWPNDVRVRVRIGIHSGHPTLAPPNYIGMAVNTAARICAAAHGGQILVSAETREATRGETPDGVRFKSLGEYRLRGLPVPVHVYQVMAKGLPARFPPPRTAVSG
jgi:class 3 adenylate cyclase